VFGTVIGFSLYFYILKKLEASRVALIPLITPVSALLLGQFFNGETISAGVWQGTAFILLAISLHQWGDKLLLSAKSLLIPVNRPLG
jgi:drug/metabolite transporter (DMT)-like permease